MIIELTQATPEDMPRIENMMEFYNYDLSDSADIDFADHGLYQLQPKTAYWARHLIGAFLIHVNGKLTGFAVVDNEVLEPHNQYNMGYFFVARRYRGQGVGRQVVAQLLSKFPGRWEIYHLNNNQPAQRFWHALLRVDKVASLVKEEREIHGEACAFYQFLV